jgi:UDP-glucose:(heptosyl)LPS alpha-1,3-glucosyltransferase
VHVKPVRTSLLTGLQGPARVLRWLKIGSSPRLLSYLLLEALRFRALPGRHIVAASPSLQEQLLASYPSAAAMSSVITPGVFIPSTIPQRAAARQLLALPGHGRWLLFVANDYAKKGLGVLLQALAGLPADVSLLVVGQPAQVPAFRARAQSLGVLDRVHFAGALDDMTPAYAASDCLAHPTTEDSFAMVVLEAMAHGLPVVVSGPHHCGIASLLDDGKQALLLADPHDASALRAALLRALDDAALRERLIQAGSAFAAQHQWSEAARRQDQVYQAAALRLRPPA